MIWNASTRTDMAIGSENPFFLDDSCMEISFLGTLVSAGSEVRSNMVCGTKAAARFSKKVRSCMYSVAV